MGLGEMRGGGISVLENEEILQDVVGLQCTCKNRI